MVLAAVAGGVVGFFVTDASCAPGSCTPAAAVVAGVVAIVAAVGIGVIAVLALRSLDEFQSHREREILTETDAAEESPPVC